MADRQDDRGLRRRGRGLSSPDFAVIGGGIVGVSAAAFLAEAGASVELFERDVVAAAASGRNSGALQHPFDEVLLPLHEETLAIYRSLEGFAPADRPAGVLMLERGPELLEPVVAALARDCPELSPELVGESELAALEPELAAGLAACRIETGFPVRPAAATNALADLARRNGVVISEGTAAAPAVEDGRAVGVLAGGERRDAGSVLVAAGPWTPALVDPAGRWRPIRAVWGALAEVELERPPRHVVEEAGVEAVASGDPGSVFSLVTAEGSSSVGSTFLAREPDHAALAPSLLEAGAAFVPALRDARIVSTRACARPQSGDGRPLVGPVAGVVGLHVAAGHGPWGISAGPATGRLAARVLLGDTEVPAALAAVRFGPAA